MKKLILLGLAGYALYKLRGSPQRRTLMQPQPQSAPMQTWESEGGALPETGSQTGPDPALSTAGTGLKQSSPVGVH